MDEFELEAAAIRAMNLSVSVRPSVAHDAGCRSVQGAVQLGGVLAQPASPQGVVGAARRDERPEARPVTEDAQMRELVDDHGFETLRRSEDEPPREGEPALPGGTPPARPLIANADRDGIHLQSGCVACDLAL